MAGSPAIASSPDGGRFNFWPLLLVVVILGFAFLGDRGILHMIKLTNQKTVLETKLADVNARNEKLREEIDSLRNDRRYIEKIARTELGMVRDDELVFQFADKN